MKINDSFLLLSLLHDIYLERHFRNPLCSVSHWSGIVVCTVFFIACQACLDSATFVLNLLNKAGITSPAFCCISALQSGQEIGALLALKCAEI